MKYKNRYRKAKQFKFPKLSTIDFDGCYSEFDVDDEFTTMAKNGIKRSWDYYDYKHWGSFYHLNARPYRRLIESSVGRNWDDTLNYIKRKSGNKGERFYILMRMARGNFPNETCIDNGVIYELKKRWYDKVSPGDIYIGEGNIVQRMPRVGGRNRCSWKRNSDVEKFQDKYAEGPYNRRKLLVNKDLMYREEKYSWRQRLGGGKFKIVDEYNWFRMTYREYLGEERKYVKNPDTGVYETVTSLVMKSQRERFSANKKEILKHKLREL